jgi:hypothetical protein
VVLWALFIFVIAVANLNFGFFRAEKNTWALPSVYGNLFNALVFYGNACWLKPRYHGRPKAYRRALTGYLLLLTAVETLIDLALARHYYRSVSEIVPVDPTLPEGTLWAVLTVEVFLLANLPVHLIFLVFSVAYRNTIETQQSVREKQELQQQKLQAELSYLKAQINPHFLFNGINNLYHLIDEDAGEARQFLMQFAGLLRYQLYECETDLIPLERELTYLENYIALQQKRKGEDAVIRWDFRTDQEQARIAPLLLTPFVENAFKYLSAYPEPHCNQLSISLSVANRTLHFFIRNTFQPDVLPPVESSRGIGIANTQKRLHLLYPGKHDLDINRSNGCFEVRLLLQLQ